MLANKPKEPDILEMAFPAKRRSGFTDWFSISTSGCRIHLTTNPDSPILQQFYNEYDKAFVLAQEKEDFDGFQACLRLNSTEAYAPLSLRFLPYCEVVLLMESPDGEIIGGANFVTFAHELAITVNLNYIFINRRFRRKGLFRELVATINLEARHLFQANDTVPGLIFVEQNDPLKMSTEDYERDSQHSGIDQYDRLAIWSRLGARLVDHDYAQPALSPGQGADDSLILAVLGIQSSRLDSCLLLNHLRAFFGISVLKGADLSTEIVAIQQLNILTPVCADGGSIRLLDYPTPLDYANNSAGCTGFLQYARLGAERNGANNS